MNSDNHNNRDNHDNHDNYDNSDTAVLRAVSTGFNRLDHQVEELNRRLTQLMRFLFIGGASMALSLAVFMAVLVWTVTAPGVG